MKKLLSILLSTIILAGFVVGCTKNEGTVTDNNKVTLIEGKSFDNVIEEVKELYGENYLANMEMDESRFVETTDINMNNVDKFYAAEPMISAHVDRFISIKAKEGKGSEVEKQLNAYRDTIVNDTMQYPANIAKVQSSQVRRFGDYVYFVMLGKVDEKDDATESERLEYAQKEVKRGFDKIESFFNI